MSAEEEGEGRSREGIYSTKVPLPVMLQPTLYILSMEQSQAFFFSFLPFFFSPKVSHVWKNLLVVKKMTEFKP